MVRPDGMVTGLHAVLARTFNKEALKSMKSAWADMLADGIVTCAFDQEPHSLQDIIAFFVLVLKIRRSEI